MINGNNHRLGLPLFAGRRSDLWRFETYYFSRSVVKVESVAGGLEVPAEQKMSSSSVGPPLRPTNSNDRRIANLTKIYPFNVPL